MIAIRRPLVVEGTSAELPGSGITSSMVRLNRAVAGAAAALGTVAILGWVTGVSELERIYPGTGTVRFNTAVAVVLLSAAWFAPSLLRMALASAAFVITGLTLFEYVARVNLGIDQLVVHSGAGEFPGRMSVLSASSLSLLALAHLLLLTRHNRWAQDIALVVLLLACLLLLGAAYNVPPLTSVQTVSRVSALTATTAMLLSVAVLAAIPDGALNWAVSGRDPGATLIRRLLPLAIVGLPVLGFVCELGAREGLFDNAETAALIVVVSAVTVGVFAWTAARRVARIDRGRAQAIAELTDLRLDLERQVQERASQLQSRHDEIAVLEDRQRIAADLHDIVIQRLFAAGMYLQSGAAGADEETRRRLNSAVESMDFAIKDLRASIFELGGRARVRTGFRAAISEICVDSAHMLGFEPEIVIEDPEGDAESFRDDILAVIREALANVARHAEASAVDVVLRTGDGHVWLTVTDNGKGITESARRSGTRNMAQRAREYGGDCVWTTLDPKGTRVLWRVPLETVASAVQDGPPVAPASPRTRRPVPGSRRPAGLVADTTPTPSRVV